MQGRETVDLDEAKELVRQHSIGWAEGFKADTSFYDKPIEEMDPLTRHTHACTLHRSLSKVRGLAYDPKIHKFLDELIEPLAVIKQEAWDEYKAGPVDDREGGGC